MTTPSVIPPTPLHWRIAISGTVALVAAAVVLVRSRWSEFLPGQVCSLIGAFCFIGVVAAFSTNLRAVNPHTLVWGVVLQVGLALFVLKFEPGFWMFDQLGKGVAKFLEFTDAGSKFVFGSLAEQKRVEVFAGQDRGFLFAFKALPTIIFVSSFFSVLYYLGVLQLIVRGMAFCMRYMMRTSGPETLSASANVFMGQTEAPLIIKPYVSTMTTSELLALMVGGMATVSGGLMALYIGLGANPVAILTTSVMAAPCSLYLAKILIPELEKSRTLGSEDKPLPVDSEEMPRSVIEAASNGARDGMMLALNVAAMLIAFLAFIAMFDAILQAFGGPKLASLFGILFAPLAVLLGVEPKDVPIVANLLGTKLVANELVAFTEFKENLASLSERTKTLATFALTGFANISSIGIQIGGIGALAPSRRGDLARLGPYALLAGFIATLVNACLAGVLTP